MLKPQTTHKVTITAQTGEKCVDPVIEPKQTICFSIFKYKTSDHSLMYCRWIIVATGVVLTSVRLAWVACNQETTYHDEQIKVYYILL